MKYCWNNALKISHNEILSWIGGDSQGIQQDAAGHAKLEAAALVRQVVVHRRTTSNTQLARQPLRDPSWNPAWAPLKGPPCDFYKEPPWEYFHYGFLLSLFWLHQAGCGVQHNIVHYDKNTWQKLAQC